jgi:hypothetical protein
MPYNTNHFTVGAHNKLFITEASDLAGVRDDIWETLYPDACDIGLKLVSERTGKEAHFYLVDPVRDADNDVVEWELLPTTETKHKFPNLQGWKVIVLND